MQLVPGFAETRTYVPRIDRTIRSQKGPRPKYQDKNPSDALIVSQVWRTWIRASKGPSLAECTAALWDFLTLVGFD